MRSMVGRQLPPSIPRRRPRRASKAERRRLRWRRRRSLHRQTRLVVFLTGQNLTGDDAIAFLNQDVTDDAAATGRDLDDAALDVDLAIGDN